MLAFFFTQLLALGAIAPSRAQEVACYAPDGKTLADNETYVPCNKLGVTSSGVYSSCCALDGDPDERDLCTTTGLCLRDGVLSRGYCTDKSWDSDACVNVCTKDEEGGSTNSTVEMTSCTDGSYCCGINNLTCCGTDWAVTIPTQASVVASNVTETAVITETSTPSTYKNATIGLAVVLGVLALAGVGAIFYLLRKNKALYAQLNEKTPAPDTPAGAAAARQTFMSQSTQPYHDQYPADGTTAASSPHMQHTEYVQHLNKFSPAPTSPAIQEVEGTQRWSELDGATRTGHSGGVPSSPPPDHSTYTSPMHSPRVDQ